MDKNKAALLLQVIIDRVPLSQAERQQAYNYINILLKEKDNGNDSQ